MDQVLQEIGLPRVQNFKESKQSLLRAMKEFIDPTYWEWEYFHSNLLMVKDMSLWDLMELKLSVLQLMESFKSINKLK